MTSRRTASDDEISQAVPSLHELNGAGKELDSKNPDDRKRLSELILKASQIIDDIEDAAIILEIPKAWIELSNMTAWNKGKAMSRAAVSRAQLVSSLKGNTISQIWAGKQKLGQSDRPNSEKYLNKRYNTGPDLEEAKDKLARAFGKPTEKKRKRKVA